MCSCVFNSWTKVRIPLWPVSQSNPTPSKPQFKRKAFVRMNRSGFFDERATDKGF